MPGQTDKTGAAWGGLPGGPSWRERLSMSLPVLLMAALAIFTWWLVRNTPKLDSTQAAAAKRHEVDYDMRSFVSWRFVDDGSMRTTVEGSQMRHFADDGAVEVDAMRLWALDDSGRVMRASAHLAQGDAELRHVHLLGAGHVVREAAGPAADRATLAGVAAQGRDARLSEGWLDMRGEELWIDTQEQNVRSQRSVSLLSEAGRVDAGTLDHNGKLGLTRFGKGVRGSYLPPGQTASAPAAEPAPGMLATGSQQAVP